MENIWPEALQASHHRYRILENKIDADGDHCARHQRSDGSKGNNNRHRSATFALLFSEFFSIFQVAWFGGFALVP